MLLAPHGMHAGGHGGGHGHGHHGNPEDLDAYLAKLEGPDRAAWQKPDEVVRALRLRRGDVVCDAGAGPGYFALRLARAVGPRGRVYALDVEPRMIAELERRLDAARAANVRPILVREGDAPLPPRPCDLVLVVDTFHHFPDGPATLRALARRLRPGGRIVNVDFHRREMPVGPPLEHKVAREDFVAAAREAGLAVVEEHDFLPYQYFLVLEPERRAPRSRSGSRSTSRSKSRSRSRSSPRRRSSPRSR